MYASRTQARDRIGQKVTMYRYNFERVEEFTYRKSIKTSNNDTTEEIKSRTQKVNNSIHFEKSSDINKLNEL